VNARTRSSSSASTAARERRLSTLEGRARAGETAAAIVAEHPNDLVRDQYVMKLAGGLDIDPDRLARDRCARARAPALEAGRSDGAHADGSTVDRRELDALRWAVLAPELMSGRLDVPFSPIRSRAARSTP
jgi:hypothetical protein